MKLNLCSAAINVGALPLNVCGVFNFLYGCLDSQNMVLSIQSDGSKKG